MSINEAGLAAYGAAWLSVLPYLAGGLAGCGAWVIVARKLAYKRAVKRRIAPKPAQECPTCHRIAA